MSILLLILIAASCSRREEYPQKHQKAEFIERHAAERKWHPAPPQKKPLPRYLWETAKATPHPVITKDFFRCNGSSLNPSRVIKEKNGSVFLNDCGGTGSHSLPLKNHKEFIYPILIELLNEIQDKTNRKVIITCGHRCPKHHFYARSENQSRYSKHMIGAETAFYVQGMEDEPEKIVTLLIEHYAGKNPEYSEFKRYTKSDTDVSTLPWYNKEVFIKLYKEDEGRDFDNRHPYPYIRIQVRYDRDLDKRVIFLWDEAEHNILKY